MIDPDKKVILDADVLIHFIKGEFLFSLPMILPNQLIILDKVFKEIVARKQKEILDKFLDHPKVELVNFPDDKGYVKEYAHLMSKRGYNLDSGESACLAYAKFNQYVLASSNVKDIKKYCIFHKINYITTIDLLVIGYKQDIFSEENCNDFIQTVRGRGSYLPNKSFRKILENRS